LAIRVVLFVLAVFFGFVWLLRAMHVPIDGVLAFLFILIPTVMLLFAHYRRIGRLRTLDECERALWHLRWWRILLPREAYLQLQLSILVELDPDEARVEIEAAEGKIAEAFLYGFRAEVARRAGDKREAETQLKLALEQTPPSMLRTGLLAQLARLYIHQFQDKRSLNEASHMIAEARTYISAPVHRHLLDAIEGELCAARGQHGRAIELLQTALGALLTSNAPLYGDDTSAWARFAHTLQSLFAQLTYSQQDEHQFPLFAELYLSLGRAHLQRKERDDAAKAFRHGLTLCKQPFIADPLEEGLAKAAH